MFALDVASMGDAVTGINRADTASMKLNSMMRDAERNRNSARRRPDGRVTKRYVLEFHVKLAGVRHVGQAACRQC